MIPLVPLVIVTILLSCVLYIFELCPWTSFPLASGVRKVVYGFGLLAFTVTMICEAVLKAHIVSATGTWFKISFGQKIVYGPGIFRIYFRAWTKV